MEVYVLDSLFRREHVVDKFESLIWTERMRDEGDFILSLHSTLETRSRIPVGVRLAMNESFRVMQVETAEDTTDEDGKKTITLKGRSLEAILRDRIAKANLTDLTTEPKWVITDEPAEIARKIFHDICVLGELDAGDVIPYVVEDNLLFPDDTLPEPAEIITAEIDLMSVYDAIKNLCDLYDMGFRLVRNHDLTQLCWDIYMGCDRTTQQTVLPAVIFSPDLDNLQNTTELTTNALYKNVAYVFSKEGFEVVYPLDVDPSVEGFERRAIFIKMDDIEVGDPDASDKMIQKGKEVLAQSRRFQGFDGEINQNSSWKYGTDYHLGDLVEVRNETGAANSMQVTEQIFVCDKEGERSYPTLTIRQYINPGSWASMPAEVDWDDMTTEEWDDMP